MKKQLSLFAFLFLALAIALPSSVFGATYEWNQLSSEFYLGANGTNRADIDSDASFMVIAGDQRIYLSDDGGNTFVESQPAGDSDFSWHAVASDADGSNLIVGNSTRLYRSTTTGASWTEIQPAGDTDKNWHRVASDADGSNLFVAVNDERLYVSDDGGDTWSETRPEGDVNKSWGTIASDADGSNLIVGVIGGRLYISDDAGDTWTETQPNPLDPDKLWLSSASDSDGSVLIAGNQQRLYTSDDGGDTWTERQPAGDTDLTWVSVDSDADGTNLVAAVQGGRLYTSDDGGETWTTEEVGNIFNESWRSVAIDSTGAHVLGVTGFQGSFLGGPDTVAPTVSSFAPVDNTTQTVVDATFEVTFDEDIATSTGDITLHLVSDDSLVETIDITGPKVTLSDTDTLTIDPTTVLELGTEYYFLIDVGVVEDASGNPFAGISDPTVWSFTTDSLPLISSLTPLDDAVGVSIADDLVFVFDQDMQLGTGSIVVKKVSDDSTVQTIDVATSYNWDGAQTTVVFTPSGLEYATAYYVLIDAGAFEDINDNPFVGIADETTWNFMTEAAPLPATVLLDTSFVMGAGFDDTTYAITIDTDGKILAGGDFGSYDGDDAFYIARLNTDGSLDDTFVTGTGFDGSVRALTIDADGKILVGGNFEAYNGDDAFYIARLNTDGSLDDTFVTGTGFDGGVLSIVTDTDGKILVGGNFEAYNGDDAFLIARLNTDGSLDDTFVTGAGFDDTTYAITIDTDGKILVGGNFEAYNGDDAFYIARLNTDGSLDDTFVTGTGFDGGVLSIVTDTDGKILAGGDFGSYDGDDAFYIARLIPPADDEETPPAEEEEEDGNGRGSSSHRRSGGGSSSSDDSLLTSLLARVQELKAILASLLGLPQGGSSSDFVYTRDLTLNDEGLDVTQLQLFLIAQNKGPQAQALAAIGATGFFGPLTQAALAEFQASVGIVPAVGFFGPVTRAYINGL